MDWNPDRRNCNSPVRDKERKWKEIANKVQMFSKLKGTGSSPTPPPNPPLTPIEGNPISDLYEVGKFIGSYGPELAWKIFEATKRCDQTEASVFFFDKRWADRLCSGNKRRDIIVEVLRKGATQLEKLTHPRFLKVRHPLEETCDTMAFATEPVLGSLANIRGCLEDRLRQGIPSSAREYTFCEFEHTYGLLQITEGLVYLHTTARTIHRNICPQSVMVNKRGTWKLAGLEFVQSTGTGDIMLPVSCTPYTSKVPKMSQPDLDFTAPEMQSSSACSPSSDLFSLGLLICSLYNNGRSPIESSFSTHTYFKQLETLAQTVNEIVDRMPSLLRDSVQNMLDAAARKRPTASAFAMNRYFMEPGAHSLQYLDELLDKDIGYRVNFFNNLTDVLNLIPKKMWYQNMLPGLSNQVKIHGSEGLAPLLEVVLLMSSESTRDEYQSYIFPFLQNIFPITDSIQATALLLNNLEFLIEKTPRSDFQSDILPMVLNSFESNDPEIQSLALKAISKVMDDLDDETIKKTILPRAKSVFSRDLDIQVQENALACIIRVLDHLDRDEIEDDIMPMLYQANVTEPTIMMSTVKIYKHLMENKMFDGDNIEGLATIVMPSFFPCIVNPTLEFEDFLTVSELLQDMFDLVTKHQRQKLKSDFSPSNEVNHSISPLRIPMHFRMALDLPTPTITASTPIEESPEGSVSPPPSDFHFSVQAPSRRQSVCSEYVSKIMSANSPDSSPDTEPEGGMSALLQVGNSSLGQRRHSDSSNIPNLADVLKGGGSTQNMNRSRSPTNNNMIAMPISRARSSNCLMGPGSRRRHSSVNPHDISRFANKLLDSAAESCQEGVEKASKATSGITSLGLESISPTGLMAPTGRRGSRRCSVVDIITQPSCLTSGSSSNKSKSPKPSKKIFNKIGSEMHNLLNKK